LKWGIIINPLFYFFDSLFQSTTTTITPAINADAISWIINISELGIIPYEPNKTRVLCGIAIDSKRSSTILSEKLSNHQEPFSEDTIFTTKR